MDTPAEKTSVLTINLNAPSPKLEIIESFLKRNIKLPMIVVGSRIVKPELDVEVRSGEFLTC